MKKAKYAVFFQWLEDGVEDTFNVYSYSELVDALIDIRYNVDVVLVCVKKISAQGEFMSYKVSSRYL